MAPISSKTQQAAKTISNYAEVRATNQPTPRFCIIDGKQTIFMALNDDVTHPNYDFGIWMNSPNMSLSFEKIFNNLWESQSKPFNKK